jgi:hypothetical protein
MENFVGKKVKISWFACTSKGARILSLNHLTSKDTQLLFYLLYKIDQNNRVRFTNYKTISNELTYFVEQGLIEEIEELDKNKNKNKNKPFKTEYPEYANKDIQDLKIAKKVEESSFSLSSVKKSMKNLRDLNILTKDVDYAKTLFINPEYFYAGDYTTNKDKQDYYDNCKKLYKNNKDNKDNNDNNDNKQEEE